MKEEERQAFKVEDLANLNEDEFPNLVELGKRKLEFLRK